MAPGRDSVYADLGGERLARQEMHLRMSDRKKAPEDFAAICGLYWESSAWYDTLEATCGTQGEAGLGKICPIYTCAGEHRVTHCGLCSEFPCILLVHFAAEGGSDDLRIFSAARRAELGDEIWARWARDEKTWVGAYCPLRTLPAHHP